MTGPEFSTDQLYEQAQINLTGVVFGTIAYFKEHHHPIEEWVTFLGKRFAPWWVEQKGQGASAAMHIVVLNTRTTGASVPSFSGDETQAEAVVTDWPSAADLEFYGVTQEEVDAIWEIYRPIAAYLNLYYEWHRQGNQITVTLTR